MPAMSLSDRRIAAFFSLVLASGLCVSARLADPFGKPEAIVALAGAMGLLMVAYLVLYTVSDLRLDRNRSSDRS